MKMYTDHCLGLVLIQGIIVFWVLFCLTCSQWPTHTGGQHIPRHQGDFFGERGLLKGSSVHSADVIVDSKVGVFWFCMLITALFYNWVPIKIWKCTLGSFWEVVLTTAYLLFYLCFAFEYNGHYHQYLLCSMVLTGVWNIGNVKNILPFHVHGKLNSILNIQYNSSIYCWV